MQTYLDFEKGLAEIEGKAEELRTMARKNAETNVDEEAAALDRKAATLLDDLYRSLDPWRKTLVARHPERPHCQDYIDALFSEWTPLAGDRAFSDDHAVMGGLARFNDRAVVVIGHEKGNDTRSRIARNFGMARPEGYRKAIRLMDLADRFDLPVITLVDTPGAYPGKGAEERGQAEAIARSTEKCLRSASRSSPSSSARAAPAARSPSPPPTASPCSSIRSTRSSRPRAAPRSSGRTPRR